MDHIRAAILADMALNNNGYASRADTVSRVNASPNYKGQRPAVDEMFGRMVNQGELSFLGRGSGKEWYCLPQHYHACRDMLRELTLAPGL